MKKAFIFILTVFLSYCLVSGIYNEVYDAGQLALIGIGAFMGLMYLLPGQGYEKIRRGINLWGLIRFSPARINDDDDPENLSYKTVLISFALLLLAIVVAVFFYRNSI